MDDAATEDDDDEAPETYKEEPQKASDMYLDTVRVPDMPRSVAISK